MGREAEKKSPGGSRGCMAPWKPSQTSGWRRESDIRSKAVRSPQMKSGTRSLDLATLKATLVERSRSRFWKGVSEV